MASQRPAPFNDHTWAQASDWLLRFSEEEVDAAAREQFNEWLRRSPENVHAYLQVSAFWQSAGQLGQNEDGSRDIEGLVARARSGGNVLPLGLPIPFPSVSDTAAVSDTVTKTRRSLRFALAASLLVGIAGVIGYTQFRDPTYSTGIGEQRILNLPDGSRVTLNADSQLQVHFSDTERAIELTSGQALFTVEKDATRPFVVRSGDTSVRAIGTQFDVNRKKAGTVVTVVEGRVAVTSSPLPKVPDVLITAGQQVTVAAVAAQPRHSRESGNPSSPPVIHPVKPEAVTAWTEGLLVFEAAPLEEVVQEFNRQNAKPLVLQGAGLEAVRITGAFPASGSERITRFLQERHGVLVDETDDEIRISRR